MTFAFLLHAFLSDKEVKLIFLLLALDFVLGVVASVKAGTFKLAYVSNFMKNDVLFKVFPFFILYAASKVAGNQNILIPGFDFNVYVNIAYVIVVGALVGSLLNSLSSFGFIKGVLPTTLTGAENTPPPKA